MSYVIISPNKKYLYDRHPAVWVDYIEYATIYRDCDREYAEEVASNYRDEGREVKVQEIIMNEVEG